MLAAAWLHRATGARPPPPRRAASAPASSSQRPGLARWWGRCGMCMPVSLLPTCAHPPPPHATPRTHTPPPRLPPLVPHGGNTTGTTWHGQPQDADTCCHLCRQHHLPGPGTQALQRRGRALADGPLHLVSGPPPPLPAAYHAYTRITPVYGPHECSMCGEHARTQPHPTSPPPPPPPPAHVNMCSYDAQYVPAVALLLRCAAGTGWPASSRRGSRPTAMADNPGTAAHRLSAALLEAAAALLVPHFPPGWYPSPLLAAPGTPSVPAEYPASPSTLIFTVPHSWILGPRLPVGCWAVPWVSVWCRRAPQEAPLLSCCRVPAELLKS